MSNRFSPDAELPAPAPDFGNLLKVLSCEAPSRPTLFEFFLNGPLYRKLAAQTGLDVDTAPDWLIVQRAFLAAGYDYATTHLPGFVFPAHERAHASTVSLNEGAVIADRSSFDAYTWPDPADAEYAFLDEAAATLAPGMKLVVPGPGGVLENVIKLTGYEPLCMMIADDEQLVFDLFEQVGTGLAAMYERAAPHPAVGACISNDDWGFKSQTMLSPPDMRRFVFPWHELIVEKIHAAGKPAILHSCGYYGEIIDDVIDSMGYDGRHSYEDAIEPVEQAYETQKGRIAVMGGIDVDFVCRRPPEEVYERSAAMLDRTAAGGFALGTGNSVPEYVPEAGYLAMIRAALDRR